jgi:hypothetical protein
MVHAGARPLFLSPSVSVTACAGGRLACDASERRRGRSPDDCSSRIAIARIAGFQPDGGSSRLCTETRAIRRSDGSARGDLRVRACRVGVSCFWLSRSTRCAANRAGLRARIAPIAAGSSDPLNVVGFGVGGAVQLTLAHSLPGLLASSGRGANRWPCRCRSAPTRVRAFAGSRLLSGPAWRLAELAEPAVSADTCLLTAGYRLASPCRPAAGGCSCDASESRRIARGITSRG